MRYTRDQLTDLFRAQLESDELSDGISSLYMGAWEPHATNGISSASWGRKEEHGREAQSGVDQCWDREGSTLPISVSDMTDDEREVISAILCLANIFTNVRSRLDLPFVRQFSIKATCSKHE